MSVAIGRMDKPTTPLLRVCSNRPHGRRRRDAGPSAPNQTDGRTQGHNTVYSASMASHDKDLVYLCASRRPGGLINVLYSVPLTVPVLHLL